MKNLIFLFAALAFACSQEEDPAPVTPAKIVSDEPTPSSTDCGSVIAQNAHSNGVAISIKADLVGCIANVVLYARTENPNGTVLSMVRKPTECHSTEQSIAFSSKGQVVYLGLFPCGPATASGKPYKIHITQGGTTVTLDGKVGNVIEYTTK